MHKAKVRVKQDARTDSEGRRETVYVVSQLQNTVEFEIGQILTRDDVQGLCQSPAYDVTILPHRG